MSDLDRDDFGNAALSNRPSVSSEQPVPEKIDHREIAVRVAVVNEMQLLPAPEPCISPKARPLYVVFLIEKDVRVERRRTSNYQGHEEIYRKYEKYTRSD
jgi:hypothetical protein